ncbi:MULTISPECIES: hypothetical protein [unclassified Pseudoclavibacter]|uniref:hypothetical protein n=1 Tax=unclassified Pseudoclavibacter TaxID=2615177 RepID=UPI001BA9D4E0|nr:hypothetical protein [Pseudoclavibacter sp. Marseille-Q4354]MBS3177776.1 hypothetical protein [Pseudoclavibacter sp. Marseille-Q4354]
MSLHEEPFETREQRINHDAELAAQQEALEAQRGGTVTGEATQSAHPARATFRTALAVILPAALGLLVLLPLIAPALVAWAQESGEVVPPEVTAALVGFAAYVAAIASLITRILAVPGVETWLRSHVPWLAAAPRIEH